MSSGIALVLQQVPEAKAIKNRVHLDVEVPDLEQALLSVVEIGGSLIRRVENPSGSRLIVCADADGNEFCLVPP